MYTLFFHSNWSFSILEHCATGRRDVGSIAFVEIAFALLLFIFHIESEILFTLKMVKFVSNNFVQKIISIYNQTHK